MEHPKKLSPEQLQESGEHPVMTNESVEQLSRMYADNFIKESDVKEVLRLLRRETDLQDPTTGQILIRPDDYDRVRDGFKKRVMERLDALVEMLKY